MSKKREVILGNMLDVLDTIEDNSIDAIVCDPPYEINFMGRGWDNSGIAFQKETWEKCLRVLKPGGYLVAFGACRTSHRITCAIEDAGFEIRDTLQWVFGCLSDDTELLVNGEWRPYSKAIAGSLALAYNAERDEFQWQTIQQVYEYDYNDTAYRIVGDSTDQIVSRNHRCLVERGGKYVFEYAEALECEAGVPVLENVQDVLDALSMSQTVRASRFTRTDLARVEPVQYRGKVWCVKVASGAFVARRNGQVFVTGNSGFPKSLDVGKAIDKAAGAEREVVGSKYVSRILNPEDIKVHNYTVGLTGMGGDVPVTAPATEAARTWHGYGTALKPAHEPITLARKPLDGTVAANVAKWGTGGIDVDGCRVGDGVGGDAQAYKPNGKNAVYGSGMGGGAWNNNVGRWPPNIILGDGAGDIIDEMSGVRAYSSESFAGIKPDDDSDRAVAWSRGRRDDPARAHRNAHRNGGASEFFPTFCYTPKASRKEREAGLEEAGIEPLESGIRNNHPTVKPVAIMQWLVKLVSPPRDLDPVILDPFCGSGTTGVACVHENVRFIGIEMEERHAAIARARIAHAEGELSLEDLNELFG
jgi:DNA modification methylase